MARRLRAGWSFVSAVALIDCTHVIDNECSDERELCPVGSRCVDARCVDVVDGDLDGDVGWPPVDQVGLLAPNAWGLYDSLGNVSEWCHDRGDWPDDEDGPGEDPVVWEASATLAAIRGGSWAGWASDCRAARRDFVEMAEVEDFIGLRPVRTLP